MRKALFLFFLLFTIQSFAETTDIRISDNGGDVLNINSDGTLNISTVNENNSLTVTGSSDIRISDNDENVLDINNDGSVNILITE